MKGIVRAQEGTQTSSCIVGLSPAVGGELDTVVGDYLVDLAVFWAWSVAFCLYEWVIDLSMLPSPRHL